MTAFKTSQLYNANRYLIKNMLPLSKHASSLSTKDFLGDSLSQVICIRRYLKIEMVGFGCVEIKAVGESTAVLSMAGLLFKK